MRMRKASTDKDTSKFPEPSSHRSSQALFVRGKVSSIPRTLMLGNVNITTLSQTTEENHSRAVYQPLKPMAPPVMQPLMTLFFQSDLPRYCGGEMLFRAREPSQARRLKKTTRRSQLPTPVPLKP